MAGGLVLLDDVGAGHVRRHQVGGELDALEDQAQRLRERPDRSVLAVPGSPVIRQWPPTNSAIMTCSSTSSCPTITRRTCLTIDVSTSRNRAILCFSCSLS